MLGTLAALILSRQAAVGGLIDYDASAKSVREILADLAKRTGLELTSSARIGDEVLIVHVAAVSADELLNRIADATYGQWERKDERRRVLSTDLVASRSAEKAYLAAWTRRVEGAYKQLYTDYLDPKKLAADARLSPEELERRQRDVEVGRQTGNVTKTASPVGGAVQRLIASLIRSISAASLASIQAGDFAYYSTNPTPYQNSFPSGAIEAMKAAVKEVQSYPTPQGEVSLQGLTRVTIKLFRQGEAMVANAQLNITGGVDLSLDGFEVMRAEVQQPFVELPAAERGLGTVTDVPLSPDTKAAFGEDIDLDREWWDTRDYRHFEPLSLFPTDAWREVARHTKRNLVANVVDANWSRPDPKQDLAGTLADSRQQLVVAPGWLEVRPTNPTFGTRYRLDRRSLRQMLAIRPYTSEELFDSMAEFMSMHPDLDFVAEAISAVAFIFPYSDYCHHEFAAFGTMPRELRHAWLRGRKLAWNELDSDSKAAWTHCFLEFREGFNVLPAAIESTVLSAKVVQGEGAQFVVPKHPLQVEFRAYPDLGDYAAKWERVHRQAFAWKVRPATVVVARLFVTSNDPFLATNLVVNYVEPQVTGFGKLTALSAEAQQSILAGKERGGGD